MPSATPNKIRILSSSDRVFLAERNSSRELFSAIGVTKASGRFFAGSGREKPVIEQRHGWEIDASFLTVLEISSFDKAQCRTNLIAKS